MTTEEFKKHNPQFSHLEGDELWDAMTFYMLKQQEGNEIIKQIKPFWKTHTLRWLFYRKTKNAFMLKNGVASPKMCKECKYGVSSYLMFMFNDEKGDNKRNAICPNCGKDLIRVPNTTIKHKLFKAITWIVNGFWIILDKLKIVRSSCEGRYGMFGDEYRYVSSTIITPRTFKIKYKLKPRKWWEYIFIEKPTHNF